jgi:hypothetical protein
MILNKDYLNQTFEYRNGELFRKIARRGYAVGSKVGTKHHTGYIYVKLDGKIYSAHKLIFIMFNGYMPKVVDHIDGNPLNNKIENLRAATQQQNCWNTVTRRTNTSGIKNVSWNKESKKWKVSMRINRKMKNIGFFHDLELAELVAIEARNKYHGEFANHV